MRSIRNTQKADSLIQTLRNAPGKPRGDLKNLVHELPQPSFTGKLELARMGSTGHTMKGSLRKYHAELRGNLMCMYSDTTIGNANRAPASARMILEVSYAAELRKQAGANAAKGGMGNKELLVYFEKMMSSHILAVYTRTGVFWCQFNTSGELGAWQQAISTQLSEVEDPQNQTAKAAAFVKLMPLIWQQLVSQTESVLTCLNQYSYYGGDNISEERANEKLNGWLYVRQSVDEPEDEILSAEGWSYRFVGLTDTMLYFYDNDRAMLSCDLISLEHASLRLCGLSGGAEGFAFSLSTPLRTLELRARSQEQLDEWSEQIMAVHSAVVRAKLIPKHHRRANPIGAMRQRFAKVCTASATVECAPRLPQ